MQGESHRELGARKFAVATTRRAASQSAAARTWALGAFASPRATWLDRAATIAVCLLTLCYAVVFCALLLRRYDSFLMHALDMGNMEQAVWNTLHGQPFHFTNMRQNWGIEAFGTQTRLSFHVEPILLPISLVHLIYPGPQALLVTQTLVLASGALAAHRLARRNLPGNPLAALAFPLAYLLFPAVQAANLYEFHPVTLTAALLMWAIDCADAGAYLPFTALALATIACKEEMGAVVAALALWMLLRRRHARRRATRRLGEVLVRSPTGANGLTTWQLSRASFWWLWALAGLTWTGVALLVIVPYFHKGNATPYACRLVDPSLMVGPQTCSSLGSVLKLWLQHPDSVWNLLTLSPKLGMLDRLFAPTGFLALLNPPALLMVVPGLALILFSNDVHMFSGLAHYSAELVPGVLVASILGTRWLAYHVAPRLRLPPVFVVTAASLYLLGMSIANTSVNGFGPFTLGFSYPTLSAHARLGQSILRQIPPAASVSAQDQLDPHLSDRQDIYLFPDWQHLPGVFGRMADYIVLDLTANTYPIMPDILAHDVRNLLADPTNPYSIVVADDGYLLLKHGKGPHVLPPQFFAFMFPSHPNISHPLQVDYRLGPQPDAPLLQMLGYDVQRREQVNLRAPDVLLTTYWRVTRPLPKGEDLSFGFLLTNADGAINTLPGDQIATDLRPTSTWPPGQIVAVTSEQIPISTWTPGTIDVDAIVYHQGSDWTRYDQRLSPVVRQAPHPLEVVQQGTMLKLATLPVPF